MAADLTLLPGFQRIEIETEGRDGRAGARIALRHGGNGPPLLLLHGNPLTHLSWHKLAPALAERFHVVMPDLRGYGDSSAPEPGPNHINYSFRAMAEDQVQVMTQLGFEHFQAAGHDRGARTLHRMCLDHADKVTRAALLDIVPSRHVWRNMTKDVASAMWHWHLMARPADLAERLFGSVPAEWFMRRKLLSHTAELGFIPPAVFAEYVRCFNEKTIRGSCEDYRACATCDLEMDEADFGRKLAQPLLVLWGAHGGVGRLFGNVPSVWRDYAADVSGEALDCGHYVNEEAPEATLDWFNRFFQA